MQPTEGCDRYIPSPCRKGTSFLLSGLFFVSRRPEPAHLTSYLLRPEICHDLRRLLPSGLLDVLSSTPPRPSGRKRRISRHLSGLATISGEMCGLGAASDFGIHIVSEPGACLCESWNLRIRVIQVGRAAGRYLHRMVAGPKGPAYKSPGNLCRRVLQGPPPRCFGTGGGATYGDRHNVDDMKLKIGKRKS